MNKTYCSGHMAIFEGKIFQCYNFDYLSDLVLIGEDIKSVVYAKVDPKSSVAFSSTPST